MEVMSTETRLFTVNAKREGSWWVFEIPELDTVGQAHKLSEVEFEARGIISAWEQIPMERVEVRVTSEAHRDVLYQWAVAMKDEEDARRAQDRAAYKRRTVVRTLRSTDLTATEVGVLLGISKQRVYQIEKAGEAIKQGAVS